MVDDDAITALARQRQKLHAWSRDTGIARHGDLTQMDEQIAAMYGEADRRKLSDYQHRTGSERGGRGR